MGYEFRWRQVGADFTLFMTSLMNPDTRPERLNDFLSEILGKKIKILKVLPNESAKIAAESSLLIMDSVVQFEDGSIANVEVQKVGYLFSGQRSACYSSDLLLRQYKRVRLELGKSFTYKEIKKVYTIVLFEKSNAAFTKFSKEQYIHRFEQKDEVGRQMEAEQEKMKADEEKLKADGEKMKADGEKLKANEEKLKADEEKLKANEEKLKADEEKLKVRKEKLKADEEKLKADEVKLEARKEKLETDVAKQKERAETAEAEVEYLRKQLAELQKSNK